MMGYSAAVLTISDKGARGEREDTSGPALRGMLAQAAMQWWTAKYSRTSGPKSPGR